MKKLWFVIVTLLIAGGVLCIVGAALGASGNGFYFGEGGLRMYSNEYSTIKEDNLEEIKNVDITTYSDNINFIPSDHYGLEVYSRHDSKFTYNINNGNLTINEKATYNFLIFNFNWEPDHIDIYFPADAEFEIVHLNNATGEIALEGLKAKSLDIKQAAGSVTIKNSVFDQMKISNVTGDINLTDVKAENVDADCQAGSIKATGLESNGLKLNLTTGDARISGNFLGNNDINLVTGSVHLTVDGNERDFNRDINVTIGDVKVNGVNSGRGQINMAAVNNLKISTTTGDINITFTK